MKAIPGFLSLCFGLYAVAVIGSFLFIAGAVLIVGLLLTAAVSYFIALADRVDKADRIKRGEQR